MAQLNLATSWQLLRWSHQRARGVLWRTIDRVLDIRTTPPDRSNPYAPMNVPPDKPCGWLPVYRALHWVQPGPEDTFLDIGSGHGRAVFLASLFPFKRVLGLELSEHLRRTAQQNLSSFRLHRHAPIEFVSGDAVTYKIPSEVTIIFMYNTLRGSDFCCFVQQMFESIDLFPRCVKFIYLNPFEHDYLMNTGRCQLVKRFRGWRPGKEWARTLSIHVYYVHPVKL
ncbi:methyltransferase domain-containing protein [Benzoatithermus flavus]|uniref:Methyltransferase domain-containing protein n=1 Tax=Benzoatithermus flavus TaxID=3108223 RepID=A0ABU8XKK3_9PROT